MYYATGICDLKICTGPNRTHVLCLIMRGPHWGDSNFWGLESWWLLHSHYLTTGLGSPGTFTWSAYTWPLYVACDSSWNDGLRVLKFATLQMREASVLRNKAEPAGRLWESLRNHIVSLWPYSAGQKCYKLHSSLRGRDIVLDLFMGAILYQLLCNVYKPQPFIFSNVLEV